MFFFERKKAFNYLVSPFLMWWRSESGHTHGWLKPNGILISSIPNIRYWRIIKDLMVYGKWDYVEDGILDNTHLRFFTRSTFQKMQKKANLDIIHRQMIIHGKKQNFFNMITFSILDEFLGSQILTLAKNRIDEV